MVKVVTGGLRLVEIAGVVGVFNDDDGDAGDQKLPLNACVVVVEQQHRMTKKLKK